MMPFQTGLARLLIIMPIEIVLASWSVVQQRARQIRSAVFISEQNVPEELEWDDMDARSLHALAVSADGTVIGTGRLLPDGHIGRMAVLRDYRGQGIGSCILSALVGVVRQRGTPEVVLHAQQHAKAFYERHGFEAVGDEFMEAGIPHVLMRRIP